MIQPPPEGPGVEGGSAQRAHAAALKAGTDMACHEFDKLDPKDVSPEVLDTAVRRVLTARVRWAVWCVVCRLSDRTPSRQGVAQPACCPWRRQGQLDPAEEMPWKELDVEKVQGRPEHQATAREIAAKGTVLLKNADVSARHCCWGGLCSGTQPERAGGTAAHQPPAPQTLPCLQGLLPLKPSAVKRVAVLGPFADTPEYLLG